MWPLIISCPYPSDQLCQFAAKTVYSFAKYHQALAACIRQVLPNWMWPAGRPSHTWLHAIEADLGPLNFGLATAWRKATTRDEWQHIVDTAMLQWSTCERRRKCHFYNFGNRWMDGQAESIVPPPASLVWWRAPPVSLVWWRAPPASLALWRDIKLAVGLILVRCSWCLL